MLLWSFSALIISSNYWGEVTYRRVIQRWRKGEFHGFLFWKEISIMLPFSLWEYLIFLCCSLLHAKDSKLPVTQRNWKVNKKWLRIKTTIWLRALYPEAGVASSRIARCILQPISILCISPPSSSETMMTKGSCRNREVIVCELECVFVFI